MDLEVKVALKTQIDRTEGEGVSLEALVSLHQTISSGEGWVVET